MNHRFLCYAHLDAARSRVVSGHSPLAVCLSLVDADYSHVDVDCSLVFTDCSHVATGYSQGYTSVTE